MASQIMEMAGVPPEVSEAIGEVTQKITDFMAAFTQAYLMGFVQLKLDKLMNGAAAAAFAGIPDLSLDAFVDGGDEEDAPEDPGADEGGDEKKATDDNGGDDVEPPLAAGIALLDFRLMEGPDSSQHRYYDIAAVAIKPKGSLIRRVTKTHRKLLNGSPELLESKEAPQGLAFPKKKWGKKNEGFYRDRFEAMQTFYDNLSNSAVALQPEFLKQFDLMADPKREERLGVFKSALEGVCQKYAEENDVEIEFDEILDRAEEIGLDADEEELLKFVAVQAIAGPLIAQIREVAGPSIKDSEPGFFEKMKHGTIKKGGNKAIKGMGVSISTVVAASYMALGPLIKKVGEAVQKVLDTAVDPVANVINGVAEPLGNVVKGKFGGGGGDDDATSGPTLKREIMLDRYPWVTQMLAGCEVGSAADALKILEKQTAAFSRKEEFAGYLVYDFGPDWVQDLQLPFVQEIVEPHELMVDSVLETWNVLVNGGVKALKPLCAFKDEISGNFDAATFEQGKRNAIQQAGQILAKEYFALPKKLRRAVKHQGPKATAMILKLAQQTVNLEADMLGQICVNWAPTSAAEVTPMFVDSLRAAAQTFAQTTAIRFLTVIMATTQLCLVNLIMGEMGEVIAEACDAVQGLLDALPEPLNEYLQIAAYAQSIMRKLTVKGCYFAIAKIGASSHDQFYTGGSVRRTILHVPVVSDVASPRTQSAHAAAEDDDNDTTDEDEDPEGAAAEAAGEE